MIIIASEKGHFEKIKFLVENGADVNGNDYNNRSALMIASKKGNFELVKYLVENGADVNAKNNQNGNIFFLLIPSMYTTIFVKKLKIIIHIIPC